MMRWMLGLLLGFITYGTVSWGSHTISVNGQACLLADAGAVTSDPIPASYALDIACTTIGTCGANQDGGWQDGGFDIYDGGPDAGELDGGIIDAGFFTYFACSGSSSISQIIGTPSYLPALDGGPWFDAGLINTCTALDGGTCTITWAMGQPGLYPYSAIQLNTNASDGGAICCPYSSQ